MSTTKKILIIDDEPDARAYLHAILDEEGYEIMTASDGEEGLKKVQESPPNLILLDIMMPKKSGVMFLNEIKSNEQLMGIPIVVASGARQATGVDMKHYLKEHPFKERKKEVMGFDFDITPDAFLEQPVNPSELLATVKKLI